MIVMINDDELTEMVELFVAENFSNKSVQWVRITSDENGEQKVEFEVEADE